MLERHPAVRSRGGLACAQRHGLRVGGEGMLLRHVGVRDAVRSAGVHGSTVLEVAERQRVRGERARPVVGRRLPGTSEGYGLNALSTYSDTS